MKPTLRAHMAAILLAVGVLLWSPLLAGQPAAPDAEAEAGAVADVASESPPPEDDSEAVSPESTSDPVQDQVASQGAADEPAPAVVPEPEPEAGPQAPSSPTSAAGWVSRNLAGRGIRSSRDAAMELGGAVSGRATDLANGAPRRWRAQFHSASIADAAGLLGLRPGSLDDLGAVTGSLGTLRDERVQLTEAWAHSTALRERSGALRSRHPIRTDGAAGETLPVLWFRVQRHLLFDTVTREAERDLRATNERMAFLDAAIDYLGTREAALREQAALASRANELGLQELENEISQDLARIDQVSTVTDRIAADAEAAQRRAEEERAQARDAQARSLADSWAVIGPELERLATQRRFEESRLTADTALKQAFITRQARTTERVAALLSTVGTDPNLSERADRLLEELLSERRDVREQAHIIRDDLRTSDARMDTLRVALAEAVDRLESTDVVAGETDHARSLRELRAAERDLAEGRLHLAELKREVLAARWRLTERQIYFYSKTSDSIVPYLSPARRRALQEVTGANLFEASNNVRDRLVAWSLIGRDRLERLNQLWRELGTAEGMTWVFRVLAVVIGVIFLLGLLRRRGDDILVKVLVHRLENIPWAQRHLVGVLKAVEVLRVTLPAMVLLAGLSLAVGEPDPDLPEIGLLVGTFRKVILLYALLRTIRCLFVPVSIRRSSKTAPPGFAVDLFDVQPRTAGLVTLSFQVWAIYALVGSILFDFVEFLFGLGFTSYFTKRVLFWGQLLLVYILCFAWRNVIVERFTRLTRSRVPKDPADESDQEVRRGIRLLEKHKDRIYSVLFLAIIAAYLIYRFAYAAAKRWLQEMPLARRLEATLLRRRIEAASNNTGEVERAQPLVGELSEAYREVLGRRAPLKGSLWVGRDEPCAEVLSALGAWREDPGEAIALVGQRGSGKTAFLDVIATRQPSTMPVIRASVDQRFTQAERLVPWLSRLFEVAEQPDLAALQACLAERPPSAVLLDGGENLFLRTVHGFDALDRFLAFVSVTSTYVAWVLAFEANAWDFINRVHDRRHHFAKVVRLRGLSADQVQELIEARNQEAGIHADFRTLATAGRVTATQKSFELVRTARGFFRMLTEYTGGNPELSLLYWRQSLKPKSARRVEVGLFPRPSEDVLQRLGERELFALTAIVQHGALTAGELSQVVDVPAGLCEMDLAFLRNSDLVTIDSGGYAELEMAVMPAVTARLRAANLLYTSQ